jgi:subtilisin family serine protease
MARRFTMLATVVALVWTAVAPFGAVAADPPRPERPLPASVLEQRLERPLHRTDPAVAKLHASLRTARGPQRVAVRLSADPAAAVADQGETAEANQKAAVRRQQDGLIAAARKLDRNARVLGRTAVATNIVGLRIEASALAALARDPNVVSIKPIKDYEVALSETVPYIGATAVRAAGYTGKGVRVAVLDSGIDYTHAELGGPGTLAAYEAAYGTGPSDPRNTTLDGLFPTAKVIGGYDFVGETWPEGDGLEDPDPDPIDFDGHGTHVADIIAGKSGVAPEAKLYAVKVCSAVSPACSGLALLQGMDFALDPNGDGRTKDRVDIINMSLGSDYGSAFEDDLSLAVDLASRLGVLTVAAAGNGGDKPWVAGTPANARTALSVAQTNVPSAVAFPLVVTAPPAIAGTYPNTATVDWAPVGSGFSGDVVFVGRGCPAGSVDGQPGADPYLANPAGRVALIDRGDCAVSLKVDRAAKAGAIAVLIGLVAPGDPISFSFGGGDTFVPTLVIQQSLSTAIKAQLEHGATVSVSVGAVSTPLVGSVVGSSARGPQTPDNLIKPEIGAPGASVSAVAGTGTGMAAFGGTSGATPMVAGAAALLRQAFPKRPAGELKALLMNTAETNITNNAATMPGYLAPITRIGGGEVRVDRALAAPIAAWDRSTGAGAVSFGFVDAYRSKTTLTRLVRVKNYTNRARTFAVSATFRYADDAARKAVSLSVPRRIRVPARGTAEFTVRLTIDGSKLDPWTLDSGPNALAPRLLDALEYDGYIWLNDLGTKADDAHPVHLAWQVLPRRSSDLEARPATVPLTGEVFGFPAGTTTLRNRGVGTAAVDVYSLVATSPNLPPGRRGGNVAVVDLKSIGVQTYPVPPGFCSSQESFVYAIAVNTWERRVMGAFPAEFDVAIDTNLDGEPDYVAFNGPIDGLADARAMTWVVNLATNEIDAFFFADHGTNDANTILLFCGEQIGRTAADFGVPMTLDVYAFDNYYSGTVTDSVTGIRVAPLGERYFGIIGPDGFGSGDVAPFSSAQLTVLDFGPTGTNPSERGLLLVQNASRTDYRGGAPAGRDAIRVLVAP